MPLVTIGLAQQQQAAASGIFAYPGIGSPKKSWKFIDEFNRLALNPTDAYELYTSAGTGTEVITMNGQTLAMATGATTGNDASVRTTGMTFLRALLNDELDNRSALVFDYYFGTGGGPAGAEIFIGLVNDTTALTALPTTARHMGVFVDRSVSTNYFLTSANGTTQTTTDTGITSATATDRMRITWIGNQTATIDFFDDPTTGASPTVTQTVTALNMNNLPYTVHFFVEAEGNASEAIFIDDWSVDGT